MEIFQQLKNHLAMLGFSQTQPMNLYQFLKLFGTCAAVIVNMLLCNIYFFFVASTFNEYVDSFFTSSGTTGIFVIFFVYIWKMKELFQYFDMVENTVNASKYMMCKYIRAIQIWKYDNFVLRITIHRNADNPLPRQ